MLDVINKSLAVFVAAASAAFFGVSLAMVTGGPNWKSEVESPELSTDFNFATNIGEKGVITYTTTHRKSQKKSETTANLPSLVVAAWRQKLEDTVKPLQQFDARIKELLEKVPASDAAITADAAGCEARKKYLSEQLGELFQQIETVTTSIAAKAGEAQQTRLLGVERREEIFRLRNQLEMIRDDRFAAEVQQQELEVELLLLDDAVQRAERRQENLKNQMSQN